MTKYLLTVIAVLGGFFILFRHNSKMAELTNMEILLNNFIPETAMLTGLLWMVIAIWRQRPIDLYRMFLDPAIISLSLSPINR